MRCCHLSHDICCVTHCTPSRSQHHRRAREVSVVSRNPSASTPFPTGSARLDPRLRRPFPGARREAGNRSDCRPRRIPAHHRRARLRGQVLGLQRHGPGAAQLQRDEALREVGPRIVFRAWGNGLCLDTGVEIGLGMNRS